MDIKTRLKERLLEIPFRNRAEREIHKLADGLKTDISNIEPLLNELCEKNILVKKVEYICSSCNETQLLTDERVEELLILDNSFECECFELIDSINNRTGSIYYDVEDEDALSNY